MTTRYKTNISLLLKAGILMAASGTAGATVFTSTSPSGLDVTGVGASTVGGIVVDMVGQNNAHVVSQTAASTLFEGFSDDGTPVAYRGNPFTAGIQTGFDSSVTGVLGGGLSSLSVRFTLYDGDSASGNFDYNNLTLRLNGYDAGNWSSINAEATDGSGNASGAGYSGGGFRNNILDTGWFHITNSTLLGNILTSMISTEQLVFSIWDTDPTDNYYDFTQGVDASLLDVGQGPAIASTGSVPEPATLLLFAAGLGCAGFSRRRKMV